MSGDAGVHAGPDVQFYTTEDHHSMDGVMHAWRGIGKASPTFSQTPVGYQHRRLQQVRCLPSAWQEANPLHSQNTMLPHF